MAAAADRPSHLRFEFESPAVRNFLGILVNSQGVHKASFWA
jgi:hypothetical protein